MKSVPEISAQIRSYQNLITMAKTNGIAVHNRATVKYIEKLERNQKKLTDLEKLLGQEYHEVYTAKEKSREQLITLLKNVAGKHPLLHGKKESRKLNFQDEALENTSEKKLLKLARRTIEKANRSHANSILCFEKMDLKKIRKQFTKAAEISQHSSLSKSDTDELDNAAMSFLRSWLSVDIIEKEKSKLVKQIEVLFDKNDKIIEKKFSRQNIPQPEAEFSGNHITRVKARDLPES